MAVNWLDILGWGDEQLQELRLSGYFFLREGHYHRALLYYEALVALNPENLYDLETLGGLYLQIGDAERALKTLDQALALHPESVPALINRTKAFLQLGRRGEGLELARRLAANPQPAAKRLGEAFLLAYS